MLASLFYVNLNPELVKETMTTNIAFIGKAGSGKTTAAQYLQREYGYSPLSIATPLKEIAEKIWGPGGVNRTRLQLLGVAVRDIDSGAWVNHLTNVAIPATPGPVVIDDCRFFNEFSALSARGFKIIKVHAPTDLRVDRLKKNGKFNGMEALGHESECDLDDVTTDALVLNLDNTPESLYEQIEFALDELEIER